MIPVIHHIACLDGIIRKSNLIEFFRSALAHSAHNVPLVSREEEIEALAQSEDEFMEKWSELQKLSAEIETENDSQDTVVYSKTKPRRVYARDCNYL